MPTTLYRMYGGRSIIKPRGRLLYVGITGNPKRRTAQHRASKVWFPEVTRTKIKVYPTRSAAAAAELAAIRRERPRHNIIGR